MIVIINCPFSPYDNLFINKKNLYNTLSKIDETKFYDCKFSFLTNNKLNFTYDDLKLDNVAIDIFEKYLLSKKK